MIVEKLMDATLIEILECPVTHSKLRLEGEFLVSEVGGVKYPIVDGIPVLLPEKAVLPEGVTLEDLRKKMAKDK